jgi:hypothetical protein
LAKLDVASIVATFPILAISFAFIYDKVVFPYSDLAISLLDCRLDAVVVGASNLGTRPGIIKDASLEQEISSYASSSYHLLPKDGPTLLNPSSSMILTLTVRKNDTNPDGIILPPPRDRKCTYHVTINVIDFGSSNAQPKAKDCTCPGPV